VESAALASDADVLSTCSDDESLTAHTEVGGVFGSGLTLAALTARAFLRFLAAFLARSFTSLTRFRFAAALC
jgi:hypothetical protein